jgi:alkylhydroperoxidase family enzyme
MARFPYLDKGDLAPEHQSLLDRNINLFRVLAYSPGAARAFGTLGGYIRNKSTLDGRLRELAILQVGYLAHSPYEYSHHIKIGYDFGVTDDDIRGMIADTEGRPSSLEPLARTVLRGAREMTQEGAMARATFDELETALGREHLLDLVTAIAFYNAVVRVLATFEIDVEPDYQKYLQAFPLPPRSD